MIHGVESWVFTAKSIPKHLRCVTTNNKQPAPLALQCHCHRPIAPNTRSDSINCPPKCQTMMLWRRNVSKRTSSWLHGALYSALNRQCWQVGFLENDAASRSMQMKIRQRLPKDNKWSLKTPTAVVSTNTPGSVVSSITTPSSGASSSSKCPRPKLKQQRKISKNKQRQREDDKAAKAHTSKAHKRTMNWYAAEKGKVNGMVQHHQIPPSLTPISLLPQSH